MNQEIPVVGEIVYGVWGYDATFYEFYKVVSFNGEWAKFQKIEKNFTEISKEWPPVVGVVPGEEPVGEAFRRKVKFNTYGWCAKGANEYEGIVGVWEGQPKLQSAIGTY
jgi:hypothetical protein